MIELEESIQILENYFELEFNSDPIHRNIKVHRIHYYEGEYWWVLGECPEGKEYIKGSSGKIGGGSYYVTKDEGKIYALGILYEKKWEEEYKKYKEGLRSTINFEPIEIEYTNCKLIEQKENILKYDIEEITYKNRKEETLIILRNILNGQTISNKKLRFKYLPEDGIKSGLKIWKNKEDESKGKSISSYEKCISLKFTGGYDKIDHTLSNLKKWTRVNKYKSTDNYWIEVNEENLKKEFSKWNLEMYLEIKTTNP